MRLPGRASKAQREDSIRRTVYVSDIDQSVSYLNPLFRFSEKRFSFSTLSPIFFFFFQIGD